MHEQHFTHEHGAQVAAESLIATRVGGTDVVLTYDEPAAPGYRAYVSDPDHRAVPANLETDEMRIAVFPAGASEPTVYLAVRGREGLLAWHKENVGFDLARPEPMPIAKLLGLVTSNAVLQALQADVAQEQESITGPRAA